MIEKSALSRAMHVIRISPKRNRLSLAEKIQKWLCWKYTQIHKKNMFCGKPHFHAYWQGDRHNSKQ